jgi:hypothetical protein
MKEKSTPTLTPSEGQRMDANIFGVLKKLPVFLHQKEIRPRFDMR